MLEPIEKIFEQFRNLGEAARDLVTWVTAFGIVVLLYINIRYLISLIKMVTLYIVDQTWKCCSIDLRGKYGQWAVVTGATNGIGLAFARELARRGMSVIIIARNEEKLAQTKASLEREPNAGEIVALKKDFSDSSLESYDELRKQMDPDNRVIGVLINNVGIYSMSGNKVGEFDEHYLKTMVDVNVQSTVLMTRALLPAMVARARGLVVNVSSMTGSVLAPRWGVYSATKAFVNSFSQQLAFEYRNLPNVKIVNLTTGPVETRVAGEQTSRWKVSSAAYALSVTNILAKSWHPNEFSGVARHEYLLSFAHSLNRIGNLFSRFLESQYVVDSTNVPESQVATSA